MEYKFMTPLQVWDNFNPTSEDLSCEVIRSKEIDGVIYEKIYFTVKKTALGEVRAYALVVRPKKKGVYPVALIAPSACGKEFDQNLLVDAVKDGYVAVVVDYEGVADGKKRYTFYPEDLDYCNKIRAGRHLSYAEPSARDTVWYNWTYLLRRTITLIGSLEYADKDKIVLIGIDEGSLLAWQTAGIDGRLLAMVSIFGHNPQIKEEDKEGMDCWLSGVDQRSYAPFVTIPVLHISGTNTKSDIVDMVERTAEKMNDLSEFYADFGFGNGHALYTRQINTVKEFVKKVVSGEKFIQPPTFDIETGIDGEYKVKISSNGAKSAEIWYAYLTDSEKVFWKKVDSGKKGGEIIASFSLAKSAGLVAVYARANYSKFSVVSRPKYIRVTESGASVPERRSTRILFDGTTPKHLTPVMEDRIVYDETVEVKEGALGLLGVTSDEGGISCVIDPEQPIGLAFASSLQFEVFTGKDSIFQIRLYVGDRVYKSEKRFKHGASWQRVRLSLGAFKNEDMQKLSTFEDVWKIEIPKLHSALIRNVLLV